MLVGLVISLIVAILSPIFNSLPVYHIIHTGASDNYVGIMALKIGFAMHPFNSLLPLSEMVEMVGVTFGVLLPIIVVYKLANWGWKHIPEIAGFGPGSG